MPFETILYEATDHVATITLNRPDRLNAITEQLEHELLEAMQTADQSENIRVIVLTGSGRGFCAGADISNLSAATETDWSALDPSQWLEKVVPSRPHDEAPSDFQKTYSYFPAISKPIIGAINGAAVGLGFVLPLYCDIRIASEKARFGTAFAQRGLIAEHGVSWMLPRLVGMSNALDLLYSARLVDAQEALRIGLVSRVVAHDELMAQVGEYATTLATTVSPRSLKIIKKQVYAAQFQTLGEAIDVANVEMIQSLQCNDFKEGVAHFVEKRPPRFSGN
jgi:enoyl-CoA hydratase/carnithine racemase